VPAQRKPLKGREGKLLLREIANLIGAVDDSNGLVEILRSDSFEIYFVNGEPHFARGGDSSFPLLTSSLVSKLPKVVVDMGAVPHICNGADVMAPGIRRIEGQFGKGALVVVTDERHGKGVAIGKALQDSATIAGTKQGKVVKNLHYVGDSLWKVIRAEA